jgi:arsenate reductase (thioredoxin)
VRYESFSAGTRPKAVHPLAVQAMAELAIDISGQRSESVEGYRNRDFDWVVTVCDNAKQSCPTFPGAARTLHWSFEDPADVAGEQGQQMEVFRRVRDQIDERIREFVAKRPGETGAG